LKKGDSIFGAAWDRDLNLDMEAIKGWGPNVVLSLIKGHEFGMLGVPRHGKAVKERRVEWYHLPIQHLETPTDATMKLWARSGFDFITLKGSA